MPAELDPRQIAAAHVSFPGEGLLTQATGRSQPLELLRQGVHAAPIVTDLAQPVERTIVTFRGQRWPIHDRSTLDRSAARHWVAHRWREKAVDSGGRGAIPCEEGVRDEVDRVRRLEVQENDAEGADRLKGRSGS